MIQGGAGGGVQVAYTGFWWRFLASILDSLVMGAAQVGLLLVLFPDALDTSVPDPEATAAVQVGAAAGWLNLLLLGLGVAYVLGFWLWKQATPGKLAIGARIVDARTGGKPSVGRFVLRYLGYILSSIPLGLGFLWVAFDRRKQGWHDKIAGTVVVRGRGTEPVRFEAAPPRATP